MKMTQSVHGSYRVVEIVDTLTLNSDISPLRALFDSALEHGHRDFALKFTQDSYLSTRTIAVLVTCFENVKDHDGHLAIISPNEDIIEVLGMIDLDKVVKFCQSEDELLATPVHA